MENNWKIGNTYQLLCFIIHTYLHAYLHHVYIHVQCTCIYTLPNLFTHAFIYMHYDLYTLYVTMHCLPCTTSTSI